MRPFKRASSLVMNTGLELTAAGGLPPTSQGIRALRNLEFLQKPVEAGQAQTLLLSANK